MSTAELLRSVPVLSGLSDALLDHLAGQLEEVEIRAGKWLLREGDEADSMFIVRSGRLEIIHEGPPEVLIRLVRRGDVLGELALLRAGKRSASIRARRDAELLELSRTAFEELIEEAPSFAIGLTRAMGAQLAASHAPMPATLPPRTFATIGLDPAAPAAEVAHQLAAGLSQHGSLATLRSGELATIDRAERDCERVLLAGGSTLDDGWTRTCIREAELVVAVTSGAPRPQWLRRTTGLRGCELLVLGPSVSREVIEAIGPRHVQVIADPNCRRHALQVMARRLAGASIGIVFSGGGARALAHVGVLEELRASGLQIDRFGGVSLGAIIAAGAAAGFTSEGMSETIEYSFVANNPSGDYVLPAYSLVRGARTRRLLHRAFGDRVIQALPSPFFCVSSDLLARETVEHRWGPVVDAVYSSLAIPGVFPPVATEGGRLLIDGGVLDNLPVAAMARNLEGPVIAVDVTGQFGHVKRAQRFPTARLARPLRRLLTASEAEIPRLSETLLRTVTLGSRDTVAAARHHADLVITPRVERVGLLEWKAFNQVRELGRQAAREALAAREERSNGRAIGRSQADDASASRLDAPR